MNIPNLPLSFLSGAPSFGETLVIAVVIIILFGPRRLPDMLRKAGRIFGELRKASEEFKRQVMEIDRVQPLKPPDPEHKDAGQEPAVAQPDKIEVAGSTGPEEKHEQAG